MGEQAKIILKGAGVVSILCFLFGAETWVKISLIIGWTLVLGYLLYRGW